MIYTEIAGDLFDVSEEFSFVQCISSDYACGKGIAVQFNELYNIKHILQNHYDSIQYRFVTNCVPVCIAKKSDAECTFRYVYNLITKDHYYDKPTYEHLYQSLLRLCMLVKKNNDYKIAMPTIGCGLDKLYWPMVRSMIKDIFRDIDIEIVVYKKGDNYEKS